MKTRIASFGYALLALGLMGLMPINANAIDLTGTRAGKFRCKAFFGEKFKFTIEDVLQITHDTGLINMQFLFDTFAGAVEPFDQNPDKGDVGFTNCDHTADGFLFSETWGGSVRVNPDTGAGTMKLETLQVLIAGAPDVTVVKCKGNFKRVSTVDPGIAAC